MTNQLKKAIGIDLGTTYSSITYIDENDKPVIIPNSEGGLITPSVVCFEDSGTNIIVGNTAKESAKMYPEDVIAFVKREIGNPNFVFFHGDQEYTAEEISSYILKKLVLDAEEFLGEDIKDVVITCPAYFGINEREATKKAGEIAGLNVLNIINEPTAAAISYGLLEDTEDKTVLVYDLGGGTFDITMIQISEGKIEVIVTGGDHRLGGKDWDDELVKYFVEKYREQTNSDEDILDSLETLQTLQILAEDTKKLLTGREKVPASFIHGIERVDVEVTREKFEQLTDHLVERTIMLTNNMLDDAKKKGITSFDEILLVGGSTRMPQIKEAIEREFSLEPKIFDPDQAVSKGAALYSHRTIIKAGVLELYNHYLGDEDKKLSLEDNLDEADPKIIEEATKRFSEEHILEIGSVRSTLSQEVINVSSKSFGTVAYRSSDSDERVIFNLIKKNSQVPELVTRGFATRDHHQTRVVFEVMENDSYDDQVSLELGNQIGEAILELPPNLPKGAPLDASFKLLEDGTLEVKCVELTEGREVFTRIKTTSIISDEQLEEAKKRSQGLVIS